MRNRIPSLLIFSLTSVAIGLGTSPAFAWGLTGHTLISRAGAESFPTFLPGFVRTDAAIDEIAALGPELARRTRDTRTITISIRGTTRTSVTTARSSESI
jgi:hypothetical protein